MKLAPKELCTGCMACVDSCRHGALAISVDQDGFYQIDANEQHCVDCGLCGKVCPVLNLPKTRRDNPAFSKPCAAWCEDKELRSRSASGGAFAAVARVFIEKGAVVYGAAINGFDVCHRRIVSLEELPELLGSKYQHSNMAGIHALVKKDLKEGKTVLFSGLSCQVAGLLRFVGAKLSSKLFTIDTICGGLSTMLPMTRLKESGKYKRIVSFRDKANGWRSKGYKYALRMECTDGTVDNLGMDNMMLRCFCHKETKRSSCLDCQFNGFHRDSDATIGDFWGDTRFAEQHPDGVSVIVFHSDRLATYIGESVLHTEPVTWNEIAARNPSLYWSHMPNYRNLLTRKIIFSYLRSGNDAKAARAMERQTLLKKVEGRFLLNKYEREREDYYRQAMEKQSE